MNEQILFEQIEKYLQGDMTKEESLAFENEMQHNETLRDMTHQTKQAMEAIYISSMKEKLKSIDEKLNIERGKTKQYTIVKWAVAASIVIAVSVFTVVKLSAPETESTAIYAQLYSKDPGMPTLMDQSFNFEFDDAMIDFKLGEYSNAIQKFLVLNRDEPGKDEVILYLGLSYMESGEHKKLLELWEGWSPQDVAIRQKFEWYHALNLLKLDEKTEAMDLLVNISTIEDHAYNTEAKKALVLLKS